MKKHLLSALVCSSVIASAQPPIPSVYNPQPRGFDQVLAENPYVLQQQMVSGQWINMMRFTHQNAPNIDRVGENITSQWQAGSNQWKDVQIQKDSFVLDGQNRVATAIQQSLYDYEQFAYQAKSKYQYTYGANDIITRIAVMSAVPANSSNYTNSWNMTLFYNPDGSRSYDSMHYYNGPEIYLQHYNYNPDGSVKSMIDLNGVGDTVNKTYFTYIIPTQVHTYISHYLDETSDTWQMQNADTFAYNAEGKISNYISWGLFFDGTNAQFAATGNESYHYTSSGKLDEMITRTWNNGSWNDESKTTIVYNAQDKAVLGNTCNAAGGGWEPTPAYRYLFDIPTGIDDVYGNRSEPSAYPNPARDLITIKGNNQSDAIKEIKLFDLNGKSIQTVVNEDHTIDVSGLDNGVYNLAIISEKRISVQKIAVQH